MVKMGSFSVLYHCFSRCLLSVDGPIDKARNEFVCLPYPYCGHHVVSVSYLSIYTRWETSPLAVFTPKIKQSQKTGKTVSENIIDK